MTNWNAYIHFCDYQGPLESIGSESSLIELEKFHKIGIGELN